MVTVVTGHGRSGTSLMMRMLHRGGMPVLADNHASYEFQPVSFLRFSSSAPWLETCQSAAVKILDPHVYTPPEGHAYRFVWMERNPAEQAKSMVKFLQACGIPVQKSAVRKFSRSFVRDTPKNLRMLEKRGAVLRVRFEDVLDDPATEARRVADFCGGGLDVGAMAAAVLKRSPKCFPGMMELEL